MSETSRRRRLVGRALVGASALALPLTASFSYAAAQAQPAPPVQPAAPVDALPQPAPVAPVVPAAPQAPAAPEAAQPGVQAFVLQRLDTQDGQNGRQARPFALRRQGATPPTPPVPATPRFEFHGWADPSDPEFEANMEEFEREMEEWSREMEDWSEKWGEQYAAQAEVYALAAAEAGRNAPEVIESCDEGERRRTTTADGRPRIVICEREIIARANAGALAGLRGARASIAHNSQISDDIQREILADLDEEIERIERGED